jgi:hypothetical protein
MNPGMAARTQGKCPMLARRKDSEQYIDILMDSEGSVALAICGEKREAVARRILIHWALIVARRKPTGIRQDPDLQKVHGICI